MSRPRLTPVDRIPPSQKKASIPTDWDSLPLVLSLAQVKQVLGIGRDAIYALAHRQDFPVVRVGRRIIVARDALRQWLERQGEH